MRTVKTYGRIRNRRCGIRARAEGEKIVRIGGNPACPKNRGRICAKGKALLVLQYDPDRRQDPLQKENHQWRRVSGDKALAGISERLGAFRRTYGLQSVGFCRGMAVYSLLPMIALQRFAREAGFFLTRGRQASTMKTPIQPPGEM